MNEKILKALKTKYANLGFGDKAFQGVADYLATTVTEEDQIETTITGVENLLKSFQGDIDKRVSDAVAKAKSKQSGGNTQPEGQSTPPEASSGQDPEIESLKKLVTTLATSVQQIVEKDKTQTLFQKFESKAKEKGVTSQTLIQKWAPKSEEEFDQALNELVTFNEEIEIKKDNGNSTGKPTVGSSGPTKEGSAYLDSWEKSTAPLGAPAETKK